MEVNKKLTKQIVVELGMLLFLFAVIIYAFFAIQKSNNNNVSSVDGMVTVLDESNLNKLVAVSDGEGLEGSGATYTITNNNDKEKKYQIVIFPNIHNEETLKQIRVSINDVYINTLTELERYQGGYIINEDSLGSGYTKRYLIKLWYKLDTDKKYADEDIKFEYRLNLDN